MRRAHAQQDDKTDDELVESADRSDLEDQFIVGIKQKVKEKKVKRYDDSINEKDETLLHKACINGDKLEVERLVEEGHNVNAVCQTLD